ncbi:TPA: hypothetical protein L5629_004241 [Pseudomonas aeruginosa]|nr:hypothetical protein [Pseudomonas aeruginosa]
MGSTVSTGKQVAAFKATSGKVMYVLFEETYESNCYPRTPRWSSYMIGELPAVMRHIFRAASSCEGGMLKGAGGRDITPEGYLQGWFKELENPVEIADRKFELYAVNNYMAPIPTENFAWAKAAMVNVGRESDAVKLENGEHLIVSLYDDAELLAAIYDGIHFGASRIIKSVSQVLYAPRNPNLGYKPAKSKVVSMDTPRFMRVREGHYYYATQDANGDWRGDASHCFMNSFITNLWKSELAEPLTYRGKIKAYRDAIKNAQVMPSNTKLVIDTKAVTDRYHQESVDWVLANTSHTKHDDEIHVELPTDYTALYRVATLNEKCARYVFTGNAPAQQLDLLAC